MTRPGLTLTATAIAATLAATGTAGATTPAQTTGPCGPEWRFTPATRLAYQAVTVKSVGGYGGYQALIARPEPTPAGKVPAVVLMHGRTKAHLQPGQRPPMCALWWATRLLAAQGYVAVTVNHVTSEPQAEDKLAHHIDAVKSAIAFLGTTHNPYRAVTKTHDVGLVGHSLGGAAVSDLQATAMSVKAIVGLDNIRAFDFGDAGVVVNCQQPTADPVTPRVPALGEGGEDQCSTEGQMHGAAGPDFTDKRFGFKAWRAAGVAAMETVMRGFNHGSFVGMPDPSHPVATKAHARQLLRTAYYLRAWLDLWLRSDQAAVSRLLDRTPRNTPLDHVLSSAVGTSPDPADAFRSSVFLPGIKDCDDFLANCP